jgi:hypothetical protein
MTSVTVNTYTHSVTYVSDNILKSLKDIIVLSGLDPSHLVSTWASKTRALKAWLGSQDLTKVVLEIYDPVTDALIRRFDIDVAYSWNGGGDGGFWTDTDQIRYALKKAGVTASTAKYDVVLERKVGAPAVEGWSDCDYRSTAGFVRQGLGTTIEHNGLGANTSYWRKTG